MDETEPAPSREPVPHVRRLRRGLVAILAAATATAWLLYAAVGVFRTCFGLLQWKWGLRDQLFLSGAAYLLLIDVLAALPLLLHLVWPRRFSVAALLDTLWGISAFCVLVAFEHIHWGAWFVLSIGIGMQIGRLAAPRPAPSWRWTSRVALVGNLATLVAVLIRTGARDRAESRALAALAAAFQLKRLGVTCDVPPEK